MPRAVSKVFTVPALLLVAVACGGATTTGTSASSGASPSGTGTSGGSACDALASAARTEVKRALDANNACSKDADCIDTGFSASCFDACVHVVAKTGAAAVDAAKARVEEGACRTFKEQGCKLIVPPCVPPEPPFCRNGRCI